MLGAGYLGYHIAYVGQDQKHKATNIIFLTLTFGFIAKLTMSMLNAVIANQHLKVIMGIIASLWRKYISQWAKKVLRYSGVSYSDGQTTAWDSLCINTEYKPTQLIVRKTDGLHVKCDNLWSFRDLPHGPCLFGEDGSIAMYITHYKPKLAQEWISDDPHDNGFWPAITYILVSEIELRNIP